MAQAQNEADEDIALAVLPVSAISLLDVFGSFTPRLWLFIFA